MSISYKYHVHEVKEFFPAEGLDPIFFAAAKGDVEECRRLCAEGADVNAAGGLGNALVEAIPTGHFDTWKSGPLFNAPFNKLKPEKEDSCLEGWRPIHFAAGNGHAQTVACLLEAGADANAVTQVTVTGPDLFHPKAHPFWEDNSNFDPSREVRYSDRLLAEFGEWPNDDTYYPVVLKGWTHTRDFARGYLLNRPGTATVTVEGLSPGGTYRFGVYQYADESVRERWCGSPNGLSVNGVAFPDTRANSDSSEPTSTGSALASASGTIVFTFTRKSHHVHLTSVAVTPCSIQGFGWTALHVAAPRAQKGHLEAIEVLLKNGADAKIKDTSRATPADYLEIWSCRKGEDCPKWCPIRGDESPEFKQYESIASESETMKFFGDEVGRGPLYWNIDSEYYIPILDLLFQSGCDPNNLSDFLYKHLPCVQGSTALHRQVYRAAWNGLVDEVPIIDCLLRNGADPTTPDLNGSSPLDVADADDHSDCIRKTLTDRLKAYSCPDEPLSPEELEAGDMDVYIKMSTEQKSKLMNWGLNEGYVMGDILTVRAYKSDSIGLLKKKVKQNLVQPVRYPIEFWPIYVYGAETFGGLVELSDDAVTLEDLEMFDKCIFNLKLPNSVWKQHYLRNCPSFLPGTLVSLMDGNGMIKKTHKVQAYDAETLEYTLSMRKLPRLLDRFLCVGTAPGILKIGPWALGTIDDDHFIIFLDGDTNHGVIFHKTDGLRLFHRRLRLRCHYPHKKPNMRRPFPDDVFISDSPNGDAFLQLEELWRLGVMDDCFSLSHKETGTVYVWHSDGTVVNKPDDRDTYNLWKLDLWEKETSPYIKLGQSYNSGVSKTCPRFIQLGNNWRVGDPDSDWGSYLVMCHTASKKVCWAINGRCEIMPDEVKDTYSQLSLDGFQLRDETLVSKVHASKVVYGGDAFGTVGEFQEFTNVGTYVEQAYYGVRIGDFNPLHLAMNMAGFDINAQVLGVRGIDQPYKKYKQFGGRELPFFHGHQILLDPQLERPYYDNIIENFHCGHVHFGFGDTLLHILVRNTLNLLISHDFNPTWQQMLAPLKPDLGITNRGELTCAQLTACISKTHGQKFAVPPSWLEEFEKPDFDIGLGTTGAAQGIPNAPDPSEPRPYWHTVYQDWLGDGSKEIKGLWNEMAPMEILNPPEKNRSYSSFWDESPEHAQSMLDSVLGWCPAKKDLDWPKDPITGLNIEIHAGDENYFRMQGSDATGWMTIDLGSVHAVAGVVLQGRGSCIIEVPEEYPPGPEYQGNVSKVTCQYSVDGSTWESIAGIYGSAVAEYKVKRFFPKRVEAQHIKIFVQEGTGYQPCLRAGVLISPEESKQIKEHEVRECFKKFDLNDDGSMDEGEFSDMLDSLGQALDVKTMLAAADCNQDGSVDLDEFLSWIMDGVQEDEPWIPGVEFTRVDGSYISEGDDLFVKTMTVPQAKELVKRLPWCSGFCFGGENGSGLKEIHFKKKWDTNEGDWTSYRVQHEIP